MSRRRSLLRPWERAWRDNVALASSTRAWGLRLALCREFGIAPAETADGTRSHQQTILVRPCEVVVNRFHNKDLTTSERRRSSIRSFGWISTD